MRARSVLTILLATAVGTQISIAQESPLEIRLQNGSEREADTKAALERIVTEHDVTPWLYTRDVLIDENSIPHSHPVLTLHTRHLGDDNALLAVFLHEQLHWLVAESDAERDAALDEFRQRYPEVPVGRPFGGSNGYSTYLHLIVCDLEYQATASLIGDAAARETLAANTHYEWIYERVLDDPTVREINLRHGFDVRRTP